MVKYSKKLNFSQCYVKDICRVILGLPFKNLTRVLGIMEDIFTENRNIFLAGNGGSAATASHMANDLMKGVAKKKRRGFKAIALSDNVPLITAIANDEDYADIFSSQLKELGAQKDLLIVFSCSGKSENIVRAIRRAKKIGMKTIAFLGMGGGKVKKIADISLIVSSDEYAKIEDVHILLAHLISSYLCRYL